MSQTTFELSGMSSPNQERTRVSKRQPINDVTVSDSPRSSITAQEPAAAAIQSTSWPLFFFFLYALLALLSWILLCVMSRKPIRGEKSYTRTTWTGGEDGYAANEQLYMAARILQSIVSLVTIPVTSAICSVACVAYMQSGERRKSLTLRQTMALADQGWISPRVFRRLDKLGSLPLYVAFALTLIGRCYPLEYPIGSRAN